MATILETTESRGGEDGVEKQSRSLRYLVQLVDNETVENMVAFVLDAAPETLGGLYLQTVKWTPVADAPNTYSVDVPYSSREPRKPESQNDESPTQNNPGSGEFVFDTKGGREKVYYALEEIARFGPNGAVAPDFQGGINVSKNGIGGIDITVPTFKFSVAKKVPIGVMTGAYVQTLFLMTGRTNDAAFSVQYRGVLLTFEERELIFMGASGSQRGNDSWDLNFSFEGYPNVTNLTIGNSNIGSQQVNGQWVIPGKKGTDYLWVNFEQQKDDDTNVLIDRPSSAHISRVYRSGNFALLGID
jgi:hypothetical protein